MNKCRFCRIIKGELEAYYVYKDSDIVAFLDRYPATEGHTLVVPVQHFENIYEIPEELLCKLIKVVKRIAIAIKNSLGADGIRIVQNNEREAGQVIFHLHFHIIPFYSDTSKYLHRRTLTPSEGENISRKIRSYLKSNASP